MWGTGQAAGRGEMTATSPRRRRANDPRRFSSSRPTARHGTRTGGQEKAGQRASSTPHGDNEPEMIPHRADTITSSHVASTDRSPLPARRLERTRRGAMSRHHHRLRHNDKAKQARHTRDPRRRARQADHRAIATRRGETARHRRPIDGKDDRIDTDRKTVSKRKRPAAHVDGRGEGRGE